jgi:hypothetical protein
MHRLQQPGRGRTGAATAGPPTSPSGDLDHAVTRKLLRLGHGCLDAVDEVKRRLGVPALGLGPVLHDDHVVDPVRRLPVPARGH